MKSAASTNMQRHGYNEPATSAQGQQGYVAGFGNYEIPNESLNEQRARLQQRSGKYDQSHSEDDDVGENDWAVAYTDMVTLLMAFFVIIAALSMAQPKGQEGAQPTPKLEQNIVVNNSPFDGMGISIAVGGTPSNTRPSKQVQDAIAAAFPDGELPADDPQAAEEEEAAPTPIVKTQPVKPEPAKPVAAAAEPTPTPPVVEAPSAENAALADKLQKMVEQNNLGTQVKVLSGNNTVTLRISDKILFSSGKSGLEQTGTALVARLSAILAQSGGEISIEGHTDNVPIATAQFPSNWELSAARAATVLRQLVSLGLPADKMRAIAYADTKPVKDNSSLTNRAENRRVELVISSAAPQ